METYGTERTKPSKEILQQVSSFMDGECDAGAEVCVERLLHEPELRGVWGRYHLIGDALRRRGNSMQPPRRESDPAAANADIRGSLRAARRAAAQPIQRPWSTAAGLACIAVLLSWCVAQQESIPMQVAQQGTASGLMSADGGSPMRSTALSKDSVDGSGKSPSARSRRPRESSRETSRESSRETSRDVPRNTPEDKPSPASPSSKK